MGDIKTRFALEGESQFRSAMTNAANAIKVLNAEQKLAKASFQQTGDAEKYAAAQASILQQKITQQKAAVQAAQQAIKALGDSGVSPTSRQFQQWQTKLYNAQTALTNMESELQNVNGTMQQTSTVAQGTGTAIESIGKKVNLDAVINGIGKITGALEAAAQRAKQYAQDIINFTRNAASEADDIATQATVYDYTTQEIQQMRYTAEILDTSAETLMRSRAKLANAMLDDSEAFGKVGVQIREAVDGDNGSLTGQLRDWEDVFWDLGDALVRIQDEKGFEYVNKYATQLFGKGWEQLRPIFASDWASENNYLGKAFASAREYYDAVMSSWDVNSDKTIENLTKYDDSIHKLEANFKTLKNTVAGELAPGFQKVTDFIGNLVSEFNKYLESEEGQKKLNDLSDAIVNLFQGLKDVDFGVALDTAKSAIDSLTNGLDWISKHGSEVGGIIGGIAGAFAGLKVAESVLTFMQLLASGKYLFSNGQITGYDSGGGGTGTGATGPTFWDKLAQWTNSANLNNAGAVADWFTHEGPLGTVFQGIETLGEWWSRQKAEQQERTDTFADNWNPDSENANVIAQFAGQVRDTYQQTFQYWDRIISIMQESAKAQEEAEQSENASAPKEKLNLDDYADWVIGDDWSIDEINAAIAERNGGKAVEVQTEPAVDSDAASKIEEAIGTVTVPVVLAVEGILAGVLSAFSHANGIHSVPFDGYPAILHKGERVMPAREVQSRSYNSNLYVESMYMNNGTDAAGLASAMAAAQRRTMSGFGS